MGASTILGSPQLVTFAAFESRFGFLPHPRDVAAIAPDEVALRCTEMT